MQTTGTSYTYAIQFGGACTNVVIRDCKLLTDTTVSTTYSYICPIYKNTATGVADRISFINNLIMGGMNGFHFYGGTSDDAYGTRIIFDSNTVVNQSNYATAPQYVDFTSISHNTILSRRAYTATVWHGLRLVHCNGPAVGNRIVQRSTAITNSDAMLIQQYNLYPASKTHSRTLIANNEVISSTTGGNSGIHFTQAKADVINNSIYVFGGSAPMGIYIMNSTSNDLVIKNNNIVLTSTNGRPISFDGSTGNLNLYNIDYNNLYAPTYIGNYGGLITTMPAWQQAIPTDRNSVRILPNFVDMSQTLKASLDLNLSTGLTCNRITPVTHDINNTARMAVTTMGCYEKAYTVNAMLHRQYGGRQYGNGKGGSL